MNFKEFEFMKTVGLLTCAKCCDIYINCFKVHTSTCTMVLQCLYFLYYSTMPVVWCLPHGTVHNT